MNYRGTMNEVFVSACIALSGSLIQPELLTGSAL